jgi:L-threonylcarbamoyladenylate synthase
VYLELASMARVLPIDPLSPDPATIAEAAGVLARGGLVAFPTETVYGLGARGLHPAEVVRIFTAKGRPPGHPLILHVEGEPMAEALASRWPSSAARFAGTFWPGPLTLVVPRAPHVPLEVTGGLDTVGLRAPAHPVALALLRAVGEPLAAPSANAHTSISPTTAEHVVRSLGDAVDLVLDAGPTAHGIESTVVSLVGTEPQVLRPGAVSLAELRRIEPSTRYEAVVLETDVPRAAPGMASKHYAPRARVVVAPRGTVAAAVRGAGPGPVAAIVASPRAAQEAAGCAPLLVLPDDAAGFARELYAALHAVDRGGAAVVVVEDVPPGAAWWAVADRLRRAGQA